MVFDINGKIAIITGGASGIGLCFAKELLRNGAQGVTLVDINPAVAANALEEIQTEFGVNRAIFVHADVRDRKEFENAFQKSVDEFQHIDILINNAGVINDAIWEQEIDINLNGTINGILVAVEKFFPKYKQGPEAVIVNVASTAAYDFFPHIPIYSGTKAAVAALTKSWGVPHFYDKMKVRFLAVSPGYTLTRLNTNIGGRNLGEIYEENFRTRLGRGFWPTQKPEHVGKEAMLVIKKAPNGTLWVIEGGEPAYEYIPADRLMQKNNLLKAE